MTSYRRFLIALIFSSSALALAVPASATLGDDDWLGTYYDVRPSGADISRITIFRPPDGMQIHVVGTCAPPPCDWSSVPLKTYFDGPNGASKRFGIATFVQHDATRMLVAEQTYDSGGALDVRTYTRPNGWSHSGGHGWTQSSGSVSVRRDYFTHTGRDAGAPPQATAAGNEADFTGDWHASSGDQEIERLVITRRGGGTLSVQPFGTCTPQACDWGTGTLTRYANIDGSTTNALIVMTVGDTERTIELIAAPGSDRLTGLVAVHFTNGRHVDYATHIDLVKGLKRFTL